MKQAVAALSIVLIAFTALAADVEIESFAYNGHITWSAPSGSVSSVEWASSLIPTADWQSAWSHLKSKASTNGTVEADVPMFYRITCYTNGLLHFAPVGSVATYVVSNGLGQVWTQQVTAAGTVDLPLVTNDYVLALRKDVYDGPAPEEASQPVSFFVRSTDLKTYAVFFPQYLPDVGEFLIWQDAPLGTTWTNNFPGDPDGPEVRVVESRETVVVPAGTFADCVKIHASKPGASHANPNWYEWVKPGFGHVKNVNYFVDPSASPKVSELESWPK